MKRTNPSRAFSLIELACALLILVLLAALLFPAFARARESGRRAACMSNMHQIGRAIALYQQDYNGVDAVKGVPMTHSQLGLPYGFSLDELFDQYIKNREVLFCPSFADDRKGRGSTYNWLVVASEYTDPTQNYEELVALRGPEYPLLLCEAHNGPTIPQEMRRSNEIMYYHVLRLSGQLSIRKVPFDEDLGMRNL